MQWKPVRSAGVQTMSNYKLHGIFDNRKDAQEMINSDKLQIYHWKIVKGKYPAPNQNVVGYKLFRKPRKG